MKANLFDAAYYRAVNPDLVAAGLKTDRQLFAHFKNFGINQGRAFSPFVNLKYYRESNPDLIAAGLKTNFQLYEHLQKTGLAEGRRFSPWVDLDFYLAANPDLERAFKGDRIQAFEHLQQFGLAEGRHFSPWVDVDFYLAANPDLNARLKGDRAKAFEHLQRFGLGEGRRFSPVVDLDFYLGDNPDLLQAFGSDRQRSFEHLQTIGIDEGRRFSLTFEPTYYRQVNPDLAAANLNNRQLLQHFQLYGLDEGRSASEFFDLPFYRKINPDLVAAGLNNRELFQHFVLTRQTEPQRWPFDGFSAVAYLDVNPDVKQAVERGSVSSAFEHYFNSGAAEGRPIRIIPNPEPDGIIGGRKMSGRGYDWFGTSVAMLGNNILVGSPGNDTRSYQYYKEQFQNFYSPDFDLSGFDAGAAYLFNGTTGTLLQTFQNPDPTRGYFGSKVATAGNNVLIGGAEAVYLFDSVTGNHLQTFLSPTRVEYDRFGSSMTAAGNSVLIGAPSKNTSAYSAGAAYLFDSVTGNLLQTFNNPTPAPEDYFGSSVAAVGNNVLIAAPGDDAGANDAGVAYLFDGVTGNLLQTFNNPTAAENDRFGTAVAMVGNKVLMAAPGDDAGANDAGVAYLFDGVTGNLLQTFNNPTAAEGDYFGSSVAAAGNKVLIAAPGDDTAGFHAGAAYLFDATTGALLQTLTLQNPTGYNFGSSLALIGNHAAIGASYETVGGFYGAGAVYLF
ncbi:FG-GAP repeat protein [Microseira wollei]|uniref:Hemolysin-type calcium-binding region n=1 Tax=Microseira wollei NIES-4236 TaxID=2530354 RepID=A0AAV3WK30_9CYAN|nr:FG-GAP repeat protein [Microseira wollei]GET40779.1 hypothetical protein MiSe_55900 [Microseira wollei NIES-4236]